MKYHGETEGGFVVDGSQGRGKTQESPHEEVGTRSKRGKLNRCIFVLRSSLLLSITG